ncbi:MAG TPA: hypothetical protein VFW75_04460, partial [Acetobacteraceae bacterium]|nr:hypothetical protein [Acetobacteraceae bacterium]
MAILPVGPAVAIPRFCHLGGGIFASWVDKSRPGRIDDRVLVGPTIPRVPPHGDQAQFFQPGNAIHNRIGTSADLFPNGRVARPTDALLVGVLQQRQIDHRRGRTSAAHPIVLHVPLRHPDKS